MKAIFIVYNQAHTEKVEYILNTLGYQWIFTVDRYERPRWQGRCASPWHAYLA